MTQRIMDLTKGMDDAIIQYFLGNKNFDETITEMWRIYKERPEH